MVRKAHGGTLFLDEIGDMPYDLQARLLRLLDSWRVRPVGSDREYEVNVQLVTATNCDLEQALKQRQFRVDLLHRIKVVTVRLPALRERSDFDDILRGLLRELAPDVQIDDDAIAQLNRLKWQGNVRELRNTMLCLLVRLESQTIDAAFVRREVFSGDGLGGMANVDRECGHVDDQAVEEAFHECRGNVSATARLLGVSRTTVYKHLRRLKTEDSTPYG
jgi:DNA-binding NtrC family response regulator